jgi:hypothetical protein
LGPSSDSSDSKVGCGAGRDFPIDVSLELLRIFCAWPLPPWFSEIRAYLKIGEINFLPHLNVTYSIQPIISVSMQTVPVSLLDHNGNNEMNYKHEP